MGCPKWQRPPGAALASRRVSPLARRGGFPLALGARRRRSASALPVLEENAVSPLVGLCLAPRISRVLFSRPLGLSGALLASPGSSSHISRALCPRYFPFVSDLTARVIFF